MLLDVTSVITESGNRLLLEFENGERRRFDLAPLLNERPFSRLQDPALFKLATVGYGTVVWPGNIDIAPEMLYDQSEPA